MKLVKALKVKNRLIGEINRLKSLIERENVIKEGTPRNIDVWETRQKLTNTINKLIELKASIAEASVGIIRTIIELSETKALLNWYNTLPIKVGEELIPTGFGRESEKVTWTSVLTQKEVDSIIEFLQIRINQLQDTIDEYNASHDVIFKE